MLVAQARSIRIAAASPTFFLTARTALSRLLASAAMIDTLELYSEHIMQTVDTASLIAGLVPALPVSLTCLRITLPGGQPDYTGVEVCVQLTSIPAFIHRDVQQTLLKALSLPHSGVHQALPELKIICLSMHLAPFYCQKPEKLAIAIARRIPSLEHMTIVAPGRNRRREANVWDLIGPRDGSEIHGGFRQEVMSWEFQRNLEQANNTGRDKGTTGHDVISRNEHWVDAQIYD